MSDKALGKRRDRSPSRNREHRGYPNPNPDQHRHSNRSEDNQSHRQRGHSPRRGSPTRRLAPTLTYQHPWGYRHQSGCRRCDDFTEHVREEARDRHDFAQVVVEASLADPPDVVRRRYEEARTRVDDLEREVDKKDRQLDEERERATRLSRAMQDRDQTALRDSNTISELRRQLARQTAEPMVEKRAQVAGVSEEQVRRLQEENAALRHNLALSSQRIREDDQRIVNLHGRLEEAICFVLNNGHSISATSGNSTTLPLPRPFFTIAPCETRPGRYVVPLPRDEDEKMEDGGDNSAPTTSESSTAKRGLEDKAYVPSTEGHLVQLYRDPYERVEYEDDEDEDDSESVDSELSDTTPNVAPAPAARTGDRLRARSRSPLPIHIPPAVPVPNSSAHSERSKARNVPEIRQRDSRDTLNKNVASATTSSQWNSGDSWANAPEQSGVAGEPPRWSEVVQRRPTAPHQPVASSSRTTITPIPSSSRPPMMTDRPAPSAPRAMASRGGRDGTMNSTNHGPFNGIPWVARRFASIHMPRGVSPAERNRILREAGRNVERGPLNPGQIPPRFEEAYVKNIDILRNLVERAQHPNHPGARDAVDILGELLNAASRAPKKSRHELEEFIIANYTGRPQWAKDESFSGRFGRKKRNVDPSQEMTRVEANPTVPHTTAGTTSADQDVRMSPAPEGASDVTRVNAEPAPKPVPGPTTTSSSLAQVPEDADMRDPETLQRPVETPSETRPESGISASGPPTIANNAASPNRGNSPDCVRQWVPLDKTDTEEADQILDELGDDVECPLYTPLYERWEVFLRDHPGFHVFGIPLDTTTTQRQLMLQGFLSILNRLPHPQSWSGILRLMTLIHQRWATEPQFIPVREQLNILAVPWEYGRDNDEEILQHLAEHGIRPTEVPELRLSSTSLSTGSTRYNPITLYFSTRMQGWALVLRGRV